MNARIRDLILKEIRYSSAGHQDKKKPDWNPAVRVPGAGLEPARPLLAKGF